MDSEENQKEVIRQEFTYDYEKKSLADSLAFIQEQEIEKFSGSRKCRPNVTNLAKS